MVTKTTAAAKKVPAKKAPAKAPAKAPVTAKEFFRPNYDVISKEVNKKFKLTSGNMSPEARRQSSVSTGILCMDLISGGGYQNGSWNTHLGGEGSAKSTALAHSKLTSASYDIPIINDFDFEGAADPRYYEGIMEYCGKLKKLHDLYGLQDDKGKWVIPGRVFYANVSVAEDFFNPTASLMRRIPDKLYVENKWWYVWDADKYGRAQAGSNYSKTMYSRYQRLFVEAEHGLPQAMLYVDSYPSMYPARLDEDDAGSGMAAAARALSENIPKVWSKMRGKGVILVGVNQLRLRPASQGDPTYEPAGETVKFASSTRWRQTARVPPHQGPGVAKGVETEPSVLFDRAKDTYRYIHIKNVKNKFFTPYLECWQRVWVDDGTGKAHGFDPVYDTINYLKMTGQLICPERFNGAKPMQIDFDGLKPMKMSYDQFKQLILLKGRDQQPVLQSLGLTKNPFLRERCFSQLKSGKATELYFYNIANPPGKQKDEEAEIEDEIEIEED